MLSWRVFVPGLGKDGESMDYMYLSLHILATQIRTIRREGLAQYD